MSNLRAAPQRNSKRIRMAEDYETVLWRNMDVGDWQETIKDERSIFSDLYDITVRRIVEQLERNEHDVLLDVGCGTGDIINRLPSSLPCVGIDVNPLFVQECTNAAAERGTADRHKFFVLDAASLLAWWTKKGYSAKFQRPLVICCNNAIPIMPEKLRPHVLSAMCRIAGAKGRCLVTWWHGRYFSHAVVNYYKKNPALCGTFDAEQGVDWENRSLVTATDYSTKWLVPRDVLVMLSSCDIPIHYDTFKLEEESLGIFTYFGGKQTEAQSYYDSDEAQTFYSSIWGEHTIHIGRYDLTDAGLQGPSAASTDRILNAAMLHEEVIVEHAKKFFGPSQIGAIRALDMGAGYGGLLRRFEDHGVLKCGLGVDISGAMVAKAQLNNSNSSVLTFKKESYLCTSLGDASVDLVLSMDALLHVGRDGQRQAMREAARVLRPGGLLLFSDIMQQDHVDDNNNALLRPVLDRIHLSSFGSAASYKRAAEDAGFVECSFESFQSNIAEHYGHVRALLLEKAEDLKMDPAFVERMADGLSAWVSLAPEYLDWGLFVAKRL